ncbi:hypothetical protein ACQ86N_41240 [Puia sp. P3]|uniref:hypothetical protein n=1 Tax=Puia sp. P3 TaxID=3423952 RepID=UPI003D6697E9
MYKKRLLLCLLVLLSMFSRAQINMTLQVPPVGVLVKNQLWNMLLVNTGNRSLTVGVTMVLLDLKTNQPVLTGTTLPFVLDRGARQIQAKDLGPIEYTYNGPAIPGDRDANGMLPIGNYQACYTVYTGIKDRPVVENCIQLSVDPLSPPLLNTPVDEGSTYSAWPQFTWLPPTPPGIFSDLSYAMVLVEVLPGQGKADAVEQNIPVYSGGFIRNLYLNYPPSYRSLDTGRLYAWRIVAMNAGQPAAMSDIWTFRVTTPPKPTLRTDHSAYVELRRGLDPAVASAGSSLKFTYENVPADSVVQFTISSIQEPGNPVVQKGRLTLDRGRNLLEVPLAARYSTGKIYLFQFVNSRNETRTLKFTWTSGR